MIKNFKHSQNLKILFDNLDKLGVPFKATILENSVLTEIDSEDLKVISMIDSLEILDD